MHHLKIVQLEDVHILCSPSSLSTPSLSSSLYTSPLISSSLSPPSSSLSPPFFPSFLLLPLQVKLLSALGLKSTLITDGNSPINLFNTAHGLVGSMGGQPPALPDPSD